MNSNNIMHTQHAPANARRLPLGDHATPLTQALALSNSAIGSPKGASAGNGPESGSPSTSLTKAEKTRHLRSVLPVTSSWLFGCQSRSVTLYRRSTQRSVSHRSVPPGGKTAERVTYVDLCFLMILLTHQFSAAW